jgi:hypothetical protein
MKEIISKFNKKHIAIACSLFAIGLIYIMASSPPKGSYLSYCYDLLEGRDEIEYSLNKIDFYLRQVRNDQQNLKAYKDQLYFQAERINTDLHTNRKSPLAVCIVTNFDYESLLDSLEVCKETIGDLFLNMTPTWKSCQQEIIQSNLKKINNNM